MARTVFYSWQSDTDENTNHYFIRDAIKDALAEINKALPEEQRFRIDHDTRDVPGTPDIYATILKKIEECSIFMADVSFVGKSPGRVKKDGTSVPEKFLPNSNVLIELGYAMKKVGPERHVNILNVAFGGADHLPFDLRGKRRPIMYRLSPDDPPEVYKEQKKNLVSEFVTAIRLVLKSNVLESPESSTEPPTLAPRTASTTRPSIFYDEQGVFGMVDQHPFRPELKLTVEKNANMYLRVIPLTRQDPMTMHKCMEAARKSGLVPMLNEGARSGFSFAKNEYGVAAVCTEGDGGKVFALSQIFKATREIWGIDAFTILPQSRIPRPYDAVGCIPDVFETVFLRTLDNFLMVAKNHLMVEPPLEFIAGIEGAKGFKMVLPYRTITGVPFAGSISEDHVFYAEKLYDFGEDLESLLLPFFERVWEESALERPAKHLKHQ